MQKHFFKPFLKKKMKYSSISSNITFDVIPKNNSSVDRYREKIYDSYRVLCEKNILGGSDQNPGNRSLTSQLTVLTNTARIRIGI